MREGLEFDHNACCAHEYFWRQRRVMGRTAHVQWHEDVCLDCRKEIEKDGGEPPWLRYIRLQRKSERHALDRGQKGFQETPPDKERDGSDLFSGEEVDQGEMLTELFMEAAEPADCSRIGQGTVRDALKDVGEAMAEDGDGEDLAWSFGDNGDLTKQEKLALYLATYWDYDADQIAGMVGITESNVVKHLQKARIKTQRFLEENKEK